MNTNATTTPQHPQSHPAATEKLQPRQPVPPDPLKAERVQLRSNPGPQRLKAERVQEKLKSMPGWKAGDGGRILTHVRDFQDAHLAATHAAYLIQLSARGNQPLSIDLSGTRVTLTVRGKMYRGRRAGLTEDDIDFARDIE
jgi:pterin-4a-carbinolamine dehydratase